jgi:acyl-CoA reductase-like NAD-dependent aldehyde dehydrogenase
MIIKKLEVEKASYVIFGSNRTIEKVEDLLKGTNPNKIIKMGTGLSISVVLKDADIKFSTEEICTSASIDRGNDCVSSNIVYVEEGVFKSFMSEAKNLSYKYESKDPFSEDNIIGHVHKDDIDVIKAKLTKLDKHRHLKGLPETLHLSIIELEEHHHFEEFPGPVLGIRKFKNLNHFFTLFKKDLERNKLEKNLVSAVFTRNESKFEEITNNINSYTFKLNKGSEKMNFLLEHQGTYIIKELLDKRIIEK